MPTKISKVLFTIGSITIAAGLGWWIMTLQIAPHWQVVLAGVAILIFAGAAADIERNRAIKRRREAHKHSPSDF